MGFPGFVKGEITSILSMKGHNRNGAKSLLRTEMPVKRNPVQNRRKTKIPSTLGELIQNYREQTGVSVRDLAKELGISFSMVSAIEREKTFPRRPTLDRIAKLVQATPAELLKLDTRLRFDHLRRIIAKSPDLNAALRLMVEQIRTGRTSPETFANAIVVTATAH